MSVDLLKTEENILSIMHELCDEYNFQRYAHPGSLMTLGFPINKVTAVLQFVSETDTRPDNMTACSANVITDVNFNVNILWIDYRGHHKIYDLACALVSLLNYRRDLLVFKEGCRDTQHYSWASDLRFEEIVNKDNACFNYGFTLTIPWSQTVKRRL